jgi:hypothetical protein
VKSWTCEPVGTVDPTDGCVPTTFLAGSPLTPETLSPTPCNVVVAWETDMPTTLEGMVVVGGPVETLTVTAEPNAAGAPLAGFVEMTWPFGVDVDDSAFCVADSPTAASAACACAYV